MRDKIFRCITCNATAQAQDLPVGWVRGAIGLGDDRTDKHDWCGAKCAGEWIEKQPPVLPRTVDVTLNLDGKALSSVIVSHLRRP